MPSVCVCVPEVGLLCAFYGVHLGLFHSHLAFVTVAVETGGDLPHPLTGANPLHEVGREKSHLVSAFPLVNTPTQGHTHTNI